MCDFACKFEGVLRNLASAFFFPFTVRYNTHTLWLGARDISDTNRICECSGSAPWGRRTESDRRTFNERAAPETRIDVTLDYLNGADPDTMASLSPMFYPHEHRKTFSCILSRRSLFNKRMPLRIRTMTSISIFFFFIRCALITELRIKFRI